MAQAAKRIEPESSGDDSVSIKRRLADLENEVAEMRQKAAVADEQLKHVATQSDVERLYAAIANLGKEIAEGRAEAAEREKGMMEKIGEQTEKIASEGRRHDRLLMGAVGLLIAVLGFLIKF